MCRMTYEELIRYFKTQVAAAAALEVNQSSVSDWKKNGIPPLRQLQVEEVTRGKLKAAVDVYQQPSKRAREARA